MNSSFFSFIKPQSKNGIVIAILLASLLTNLIYLYSRTEGMSVNWTAPYYSAAANLEFNGEFNVSQKDVNTFKDLDDIKKEDRYHFRKSDTLTTYNHNPIGFAYIIWFATKLFPFAGTQLALIFLQISMFLILSGIVLFSKTIPALFKFIFTVLFIFNPIVIKFTTFNFYYFWQIIPVFLIVLYFLNTRMNVLLLLSFSFVVGVVLSFRPTIILTVFLFLFIVFKKEKISHAIVVLIAVLTPLTFAIKPTEKNFFHTAYIGVGAYANPWSIKLSDNDGYSLYERKYGEVLNASFGGNYYDSKTISKYKKITEEQFFKNINQKPLLFIKNAVVNTLQGFSVGYFNGAHDWFNYILAILGAGNLVFLLYLRRWGAIILILSVVTTISPYFPPIPAYFFGGYLAVLFALYEIMRNLKVNWLKRYGFNG